MHQLIRLIAATVIAVAVLPAAASPPENVLTPDRADELQRIFHLFHERPTPGAGDPALRLIAAQGPMLRPAAMGETVTLTVRAEPGARVVAITRGGGRFANGLRAVVVTAGADALAEIPFTVTEDASGYIEIAVRSLRNAGETSFVIEVQ